LLTAEATLLQSVCLAGAGGRIIVDYGTTVTLIIVGCDLKSIGVIQTDVLVISRTVIAAGGIAVGDVDDTG
jgi:hypothetical protein